MAFDGSANIDLPGVNATGNQNTTGSAATLTTARDIGGVAFDGSANIDLPGVNATGNQNTTGSAATLTTARDIGGVAFDGSANIDLPGVNAEGNQDTTGNAATATNAATVTGNTQPHIHTLASLTSVGTNGGTATTFAGPIVVEGTTTVPTPTADGHAATKAYVDTIATGLNIKQSCKVRIDVNVASLASNLAAAAANNEQGVTLNANDRVLLTDQTDLSENGIYVMGAGGAAMTRVADLDQDSEMTGAFTFIEAGDHARKGFITVTSGSVDQVNMVWTQFADGLALDAVDTTTGLQLSGNTLVTTAVSKGQNGTGVFGSGTFANHKAALVAILQFIEDLTSA